MEQKITAKDLLQEITAVLSDEIVAIYTKEEEGLQIRFPGGPTFRLKIEEI